MQALRKSSVHEQPSHSGMVAASEADHDRPRLAGDEAAAASPALALREHLAARLEELTLTSTDDAAALAEPSVEKLPVPARLAVIFGASAALWLAIYLASAALL